MSSGAGRQVQQAAPTEGAAVREWELASAWARHQPARDAAATPWFDQYQAPSNAAV
ncbi:hypothetical protein CO2235_MP10287 [Cupriavidus oxalaticus]|uniref:Uncharacterized protein n=1 Tax=Cupriavidus oxalaticus TaxID=96344 RepID=A0A375GF44_9BURK|nr:hypothetical protein CO2235_MP10287 [Cupriavidus oxalaticus]